MTASTLHPLIKKLQAGVHLRDDEKAAILALPFTTRAVPADQDIVSDGERPTHSVIILSGFACRYKILPDGKRQIFAFHISGDMPDVQALHLDIMDHGLGTLTPTQIATVPHEALRKFLHAQPRIADAIWRDTLVDAAIFREWMANVGRREAYARAAHLLCELYTRLKAVGLTTGAHYEMPITQEELGDAMGLSTVHVNRTLQELRGEGLIRSVGRNIVITNWEGLQKAGQFDPTYLHLRTPVECAPEK